MKKPNVLFILADDHGAWAMGCAGNREVITPNLDKLAGEGTRFENFFCTSPVCSPARASILTGVMPSRHGVLDWLRAGNIDYDKLTDEQQRSGAYHEESKPIEYIKDSTAYTEILAQNGYRCALSGKWHLGNSHDMQKGFTLWNVIATGGCNYYGSNMCRSDGVYTNDGYITDTITDHALEFLDTLDDTQPFYLSVHYTAPHTPWNRDQHPEEIYSLYENCPMESVPYRPAHKWQAPTCQIAKSQKEHETLLRGYYTAITAMDKNIGRLLSALDEKGLSDDTIVIYMGDNGMNVGNHGIYGKGNGTFPLNMYDSSVKVPLIIRCPSMLPENKVNTSLLSQYDFFPTLLHFCGCAGDMPRNMPGLSFADELLGGQTSDRPVVVYDEYGPVRMIRDRNYKYIHRYPYGEHEFYDMQSDPNEEKNLFGDEQLAPLIAEYRHKLELWFKAHIDPNIDGAKEAVTGLGQLCRPGLYAEGKEPYSQYLKKNLYF